MNQERPWRAGSRRSRGSEPAGGRRPGHLPGRARQAPAVREKAHTREGDAIAAARRRLPMVEVDANLALTGPGGPLTLLDAFEGRRQLIAYYFMWHAGHPGGRAVRRLHVGHHPDRGAVVPALPRHHVRGLLPGPVQREPPLLRLHGLADAVVLRARLRSTSSSSGARSACSTSSATCGTATASSRRTGRRDAAPRRWTTATRSWTSPSMAARSPGRTRPWDGRSSARSRGPTVARPIGRRCRRGRAGDRSPSGLGSTPDAPTTSAPQGRQMNPTIATSRSRGAVPGPAMLRPEPTGQVFVS